MLCLCCVHVSRRALLRAKKPISRSGTLESRRFLTSLHVEVPRNRRKSGTPTRRVPIFAENSGASTWRHGFFRRKRRSPRGGTSKIGVFIAPRRGGPTISGEKGRASTRRVVQNAGFRGTSTWWTEFFACLDGPSPRRITKNRRKNSCLHEEGSQKSAKKAVPPGAPPPRRQFRASITGGTPVPPGFWHRTDF